MSRFGGKTVLVTGASSGLGRACAERLAADGARIVLVGRRAAALTDVRAGDSAVTCVVDVTDEIAVKAALDQLKSSVGPVHGWIMAAGIHAVRPLMLESFDSITSMLRANVVGTLGFLGAALKARMVARGGAILLFSSAAAHAGGAGLVSYAASKGAIEAATRSMAVELASQSIRVNTLSPGVVRTSMSENYLSKLTQEQFQQIESGHPLGFGTASDISDFASFLLSDEARWITGATLVIDGGFSAR